MQQYKTADKPNGTCGLKISVVRPDNSPTFQRWTSHEMPLQDLLETGGGGGANLRFACQPGVKVRLAHDFEDASHAVVAVAAQLRALNLVGADHGRDEMDGNAHAGIGVLRDPHRDDLEGMDDIH